MNDSLLNSVPTFAAMYRLQWEPAQDCHVILYPEGMVKLSRTAAEILTRVDNQRTVAEVVSALREAFPGAELEADVINFLEVARNNGWITF